MRKPWECPSCHKRFTSEIGAGQHIANVHSKRSDLQPKKRPKPTNQPRTTEMSLAEISVEAELKLLMGEELDPLEESLINH